MSATFDLDGPLPTGLLALDASAGTGKTFTLTALATRWLVEGDRDPDQLLVVTFTRAAADQLRARIRTDLRDASAALEAAAAGRPLPDVHAWVRTLATADPVTLAARRDAAARALVGFERATVSTLHAFCRSALLRLGILGDLGGREAARSARRDRDDVVRDLLLAQLAEDPSALRDGGDDGDGAGDAPSPAALEQRLHSAVERALNDAGARLEPGAPRGGFGRLAEPAAAQRWAALVGEAVAELRLRLDARSELDFGQLVARLDEVLADPVAGPVAIGGLRERVRFALIDEMQDTDGTQWRVLRRALRDDPDRLGPAADMVIVGDPKQSIYRFRGADVHAYLRARDDADEVRALDVNHRSSPQLLGALDLLLRGATFGDERIGYVPVSAPPGAAPTLALPAEAGSGALELRWVPRHADLVTGGTFRAGRSDEFVLRDLAARAVALLRAGRIPATKDRPERPLAPGDLAVLVGSGDDAEAVLAALREVGLPAVRPRAGDVFASDAVEQWRLLLAALEAPHRRERVRALVLSWFVAAPLSALGDAGAIEALQERCDRWRRELSRRGVLPFLVGLTGEEDVAAALARAGERGRTDLEHLGELLHAEVGGGPAPAGAVLRALESLVRSAGTADRLSDDPSVRRIETDGSAVQVMTFHTAKGLEFPVVLLPITTKRATDAMLLPFSYPGEGGPVVDAASWTAWRWVDAAPDEPGADQEDRRRLALAADDARVLYVALTRARGRLVVWWAPRPRADESLLARLLFAPRDEGGALLPDAAAPTLEALTDDATRAALDGWARRSDGAIAVVEVPEHVDAARWEAAAAVTGAAPEVARLTRDVEERGVRRWSFSSMRGRLVLGGDEEAPEPSAPVDDHDDVPRDARPGSDETPEGVGASEGEGEEDPRDGAIATAPTVRTPPGERPAGRLVDLAGGTEIGTIVHEVLEVVDLSAPDLEAEVRGRILAVPARRLALLDPGRDRESLATAVVRGLVDAVSTPMDQVLEGLRLRDLGPRDRLSEPPFDLPLRDTRRPVALGDLAAAVADRLPAGAVRDRFAALAVPGVAPQLGGWLTGVADLVVRLPDGRFAVLDHKTNRLLDGPPGRRDRPQRYDQPMLEHAACQDLYVLQGLLYVVALHRWLDRRMPGYDPDRHLGGFGLLFLRGMAGADTPRDREGRRDGVWWWQPPAAAIVAADRVIEGGGA